MLDMAALSADVTTMVLPAVSASVAAADNVALVVYVPAGD
jgi:hypothetical protein